MEITILPVGPVEVDLMENVQSRLRRVFPETVRTVIEDVMPIPEDAYNPRRGQYHSSKILSKIRHHLRRSTVDRVLGVTRVDLYVPGLNFVFGEAYIPGGVAVISLFRLRPEFYGQPPNERRYIERASKEAIHELGHTLGLTHCRNSRCVMHFSNSIFDTDRKRLAFCEDCYSVVIESM